MAERVGAAPRRDGSTHKGRIDRALVRGACDLVDFSGALDQFAEWRDAEPSGQGGRPRLYADGDRLILVMMLVLLDTGQSPQIAEIARAIVNRLDADSRERLGLPATNGGASYLAIYHRVRRAYQRFVDVCDPLPGMTHRRMIRAEVEAVQAARDEQQSLIKAQRAHLVLNQIVRAPVRLLSEETLAQWHGDTTIDATSLPQWGRRGNGGSKKSKKPDDVMSPEFEADWYHHHDGRLEHAYALHIAVMGPNPTTPGRHPMLAIGMSMDTPNKRTGLNAIRMLAFIRQSGLPIGHLVSDRGYFCHAIAEDFNRPANELGYTLVGDYKKTQLGIQATHAGANFIEGDWYCPSMPVELVNATKTYRDDNDRAKYTARIEQRARYRFSTKGPGGVMRCPAQGPSPTATCALRPGSMVMLGIPSRRQKAVVLDPPENPDTCCTNGHSVTIPPAIAEKLSQPVQYGSRKWFGLYKPLRSIMEGFNGYTKDAKNEGLGVAANRRVRGFFANALVAAVTLAVSNIRKIHAWIEAGKPPAMGENPWLSPDYNDSRAGLKATPKRDVRRDDPPDKRLLPAAS